MYVHPLSYKVSSRGNSFTKISPESVQPASVDICWAPDSQRQIGQTRHSRAPSPFWRSSSGAPPQALHGLQEGPPGLVLLQGGAVPLLLLLLDDAALHIAEAGLTLSGPADTCCCQRLGELLHHQRQQMGRERVQAGRHGERRQRPRWRDVERRCGVMLDSNPSVLRLVYHEFLCRRRQINDQN